VRQNEERGERKRKTERERPGREEKRLGAAPLLHCLVRRILDTLSRCGVILPFACEAPFLILLLFSLETGCKTWSRRSRTCPAECMGVCAFPPLLEYNVCSCQLSGSISSAYRPETTAFILAPPHPPSTTGPVSVCASFFLDCYFTGLTSVQATEVVTPNALRAEQVNQSCDTAPNRFSIKPSPPIRH
jgi:hypothetical protein